MKIKFLLILFSLCIASSAIATHNRAGEISYKKVDPDDPEDFRYEITIVTCTKASSPADRPWLQLRYGDEPLNAPLDSIERIDAFPPVGTPSPDDSRINTYKAIHTYPGTGSYIISMEDPNRNAAVLNMNESISQVFYIESLLIISAAVGHNNSVTLLYPAKDEACTGSIWEHNPGAYDIDGDSLAYSLIACRGLDGEIISSWELPDEVEESSGVDDSFTINPLTGTISWDAPVAAGEYNIAIKISEYRFGQLTGYVIRDMQVLVLICTNEPPVVSIINDTCIVAGNELELFLSATDENSSVDLDAVGAPMTEVENTATFNSSSGSPATGQFEWTPGCEEVRLAPYQVLFVGEDNSSFNADLIDIMEVNITVLAPPVENLTVEPSGLSFELEWDEHQCEGVISYKVYKRNGFFGYIPDFCETGVPSYTGYELIATVNDPTTTYVDDDDIDFGVESCFMIVACFENGSESVASDEICASIDLIIPVITKVSVGITNSETGEDTVHWAPPFNEDTALLVSPFKYKLYHNEGFSAAEDLIYETPTEAFISDLESEFLHENINTESTPNSYRVELEDAAGNTISSFPSSSLFLTLTPDDNVLELSWNYDVSWENIEFDIYKQNSTSLDYEFLATTEEEFYVDTGLVNNVDYCYYVISRGTFNSILPVLPVSVINFSQQICGFPVDLTAPCPPEFSAEKDCETGIISMVWNNPNNSCADDVTGYNIYYKPFLDVPYTLLDSLTGEDNTEYEYVNSENITGCYYVTAIDSLLPGIGNEPNQNESLPSIEFCFENCPEYSLPNVFTPQGDGFNDFFQPFPYSYVDSIDLSIFNRWGTLVFQTNDPDIMWNGTNLDSGEISTDGVYFYTISIFTNDLNGIREEKRSGDFIILGARKQTTD